MTVSGFDPLPLPFLSSLPLLEPSVFSQTVLGYLAFLLVPLLWFGLYRTIPGLQLRMVSEGPSACAAQGVPARRTLMLTLAILAGYAGSAKALATLGAPLDRE